MGAALAILVATGCAASRPRAFVDDSAPRTPSAPKIPAGEARPAPAPPAALALSGRGPLSLAALVDLALALSPQTRAAWRDARIAAAQVGGALSSYYPVVEVNGQIQLQHTTTVGGAVVFDTINAGPGASLSFLVLDLGGRAATVDEARQALAVANLTHFASIQDLVLRVEQAYYQLLALKALRDASQATLRGAETALAAATDRQKAGLATIADVLQARTAASQARLSLRATEGLAETARGALASALGLRASQPLEVGELPEAVQLEGIDTAVDALLAEAAAQRPDLAAARAQVARGEARLAQARSIWLPTLSLGASASRQLFLNKSAAAFGDNYGLQLTLRVPLFDGFKDTYGIRQAEEALEAARARVDIAERSVELQVWTSHQSAKTAAQRLAAAKDLLDSARASEEVSAGRYRAGVGSLLDLLAAQTALANARAQDIEARGDYLVSLAALAHDTGRLSPSTRPPAGDRTP